MVINADDYYGKEGFRKIHDYMVMDGGHSMDGNPSGGTGDGVYHLCMGGFILENTLSENGGVTRGVCRLDKNGCLQTVTETYDIKLTDGKLTAADVNGNPVPVEAGCHASMNMWGLPASFLNVLEEEFPKFLSQLKEGDIKSEYLLPEIINQKVKEGKASVKVLETRDKWFGVTYREDKQAVVDSLKALIAAGAYPGTLY